MLTCEKLELRQDDFRLSADVTFAEGMVTALIGPSGAGKSTLLAGLAGFVTPVSGRVLWQGNDILALSPAARPFSMLFQDNNLFPHMTAAQNIGLGLSPNGRLSQVQQEQVAEALRAVGLEGYEKRLPAALSGGQQSRVALARVIVANRPVVLLDEPFAALGPALKDEMLTLVRQKLVDRKSTRLNSSHAT